VKKVLVILATIVGVIALGNVIIAGAQNSGVRINSPLSGMMNGGMMNGAMMNSTGNYTGTLPFGRGMHSGTYTGTMPMPFGGQMQQMHAQMSAMQQKVLDAVSAKLNMTSSDLIAALQNGQTLTDLATAKNVALSDLQAAADAAHTAALADLVKQNVITQAQADLMLAHMQDMRILGFGLGKHGLDMRDHMRGGFGPNGGMPGRGMMHGFPGGVQPQQPPVTTPSNQG
jgi:hypothetical protein